MPQDSHRCHERLCIVKHRLPVEAKELAACVAHWRQDLDRLEPIAPFPARMLIPPLNVGGPCDQRVAIPEADRVPIPLRHALAEREIAAKVNDAPHVAAAAAHEK